MEVNYYGKEQIKTDFVVLMPLIYEKEHSIKINLYKK